MTNVTAEQRQQLQALVVDAAQIDAVPASAALAKGIDPKALFCENWAAVKKVLEFIRDHFPVPIPGFLKLAITALIRIGDGAHAILCG